MNEELKLKQRAGEAVERQMIEFLLQYAPAHDLKVSDVLRIAYHARIVAFDRFTESPQ